MSTYKKVMESKSIPEALRALPSSFFDKVSFLILGLYIIYPFLSLIKQTIYPELFIQWRSLNRSVLIIGTAFILLFIFKQIADGKPIKPLEFLKKHIPLTLFGVFALIMIISTAINGFSTLTLFGNYYRSEGLLGYLSYIVYFILAIIMQNEKLRKALIYCFVGISSVLELFTVVNFYLTGAFRDDLVFDQFNHYGYYICVSFVCLAMLSIISDKLWRKLLFFGISVFSFLALIINDTFGCQLAIIAGIFIVAAIFSIAKGRFMVKSFLPALAVVVSFTIAGVSSSFLSEAINDNFSQLGNDTIAISDGKDEAEFSTGVSRIILWENTCRYISERPVFGFGADVTGDRLFVDSNGDNDRCHCEFMNYAVCFGIPAALVYIAAVFMVYLRGLLHKKSLTDINFLGLCVAITYLASSLIGNSMFYTAPLLFIFLGLGYVIKSPKT